MRPSLYLGAALFVHALGLPAHAQPAAGIAPADDLRMEEIVEDALRQPPAAPASEPALADLDPDAVPDAVNAAVYREHLSAIRGASPIILKMQVLLDRANASPGIVDSYFGPNVAKAIATVEAVAGLPVDGRLDREVWAALGGDRAAPVLVPYEITADDLAGPFVGDIPEDYSEQARMERLAYRDPAEMFAERFHMDIDLLKALNPEVDFAAPGTILVVAATEGAPITQKVTRLEADKRHAQLRAFGGDGRLVAAYPATIGSRDNPSPSGMHEILAAAPDPVYYYDPETFRQGDNDRKLELPPGPNNPVGTVWIDLSEDGYGIHGTPEPAAIDKTYSHGCVRLTNWDAEELSRIVEIGATVEFVQ